MIRTETDNSKSKINRITLAGLIGVCLLIYGQVLGFEFINFDDNLYVYENPFVIAGINAASLKWAFTAFHSANWHPLTWISHMLDASVFGMNAGGHHFVNVIFHTASSVLAYFVFKQMTGDTWKSAMIAFLFAVHPAHVESVAWVSERKDVLSTLFWLLGMFFYIKFVKSADERSPVPQRTLSRPFLLTTLFMALGLMSKPMLVTFPFVLLLCDYWPLERVKKIRELGPLIVEKLPLFILSGASAYITIQAQRAYGAIQSTQIIPVDARLENAVVSYAKYITTLFYPANLGVGYAYQYPFPAWQIWGSVILLLGITVFCIWQINTRKYLIVGWLWFLGTMVPVIGLVQVGAQSMADRYTYVPYFGLFIMAVWGAADLLRSLHLNFSSTAVVAAVPIMALSVVAFDQTSHWKNGITLYSHTLNAGQGNFITIHNLCSALNSENRLAEAEIQCRSAINANPGFVDSHILLGVVNVRLGKNDEAIANFNRALELDPQNPMALSDIAVPLAISGKTDEAEENLNAAFEIYRRSGNYPASLTGSYSNLAAAFAKQNRFDKTAASLKRVLQLTPEKAEARANLALALQVQNKLPEAKTEIEEAIRQDPDRAESYNTLGMILLKLGDRENAIAQFRRALQIKPAYAEAKDNLEKANAGK